MMRASTVTLLLALLLAVAGGESDTVSLTPSLDAEPQSLLDKLLAVDETNRAGDAALTLALSGLAPEGAMKVLVATTQIVSAAGAVAHPMGAARASNLISLATTRRCNFDPTLDFVEGPSAVLFTWKLGSSDASAVAGPAVSTAAIAAGTHFIGVMLHRSATMGVGMRKRWGQLTPAALGFFLPTAAALGTVTFLKAGALSAKLAGAGAVVLALASAVGPVVFLALFAGRVVPPTDEQRRASVETLRRRDAALARMQSTDAAPVPLEDSDADFDPEDDEAVERVLSRAADPEIARRMREDQKILEQTADAVVYDDDEAAPSPAEPIYTFWPMIMHARALDRATSRCFLFEELLVAWMMAVVGDMRQGVRNCALAAVLQMLVALFHVIYLVVADPLGFDFARLVNGLAAAVQVVFAFTIVLDNVDVSGAQQWVGLAGVLLAVVAIAEAGVGGFAFVTRQKEIQAQIDKRSEEEKDAAKDNADAGSDGGEKGDGDDSPSPRNPLADPFREYRNGARGTSLETFQVAVLGEPGFLHDRLARQRTLERNGMCFEYRLDATDVAKLAAMSPAMRQKMLEELDDAAVRRSNNGESPPRQGPAPLPPPKRRRPVPSPYAEEMFEHL